MLLDPTSLPIVYPAFSGLKMDVDVLEGPTIQIHSTIASFSVADCITPDTLFPQMIYPSQKSTVKIFKISLDMW